MPKPLGDPSHDDSSRSNQGRFPLHASACSDPQQPSGISSALPRVRSLRVPHHPLSGSADPAAVADFGPTSPFCDSLNLGCHQARSTRGATASSCCYHDSGAEYTTGLRQTGNWGWPLGKFPDHARRCGWTSPPLNWRYYMNSSSCI